MKYIIFLQILLGCTFSVYAQVSYKGCGLSSHHQVNIERLLQYNFSNEKTYSDQPITMELLLGNGTANRVSNKIFLQISLEDNTIEKSVNKPLNLALVLDRSASMSQNARMEKLKIALKEFCKMLGPNDYVSIVTYDNNASVIFPAQKVTDSTKLLSIVDNIALGGGTNIWAGMQLGYQELMKHANLDYSNRLILMSDGDSNVGVRSLKDIVSRSKFYNDQGIETSTIGLGSDINFELLHSLAKEGKGLSHFITDCDNIKDDILEELDTELLHLLSAPHNIVVSLSCPKNVEIEEVYGFELGRNKRSIDLDIGKIGSDRKIILVRLNILKTPRKCIAPIQVTLCYSPDLGSQTCSLKQTIVSNYEKRSKKKINLLKDSRVWHNFTIAYSAQELKIALKQQEVKDYYQCYTTICKCINDLDQEIDLPQTENFLHLYNLLDRQKKYLNQMLGQK